MVGVAKDLGIFGTPTFAVGHEIFYGDDRLKDAMSWTLLSIPSSGELGSAPAVD